MRTYCAARRLIESSLPGLFSFCTTVHSSGPFSIGTLANFRSRYLMDFGRMWLKCARRGLESRSPPCCCSEGGLPMSDPRDVIYAAIHSAFVKYPKQDDPA